MVSLVSANACITLSVISLEYDLALMIFSLVADQQISDAAAFLIGTGYN